MSKNIGYLQDKSGNVLCPGVIDVITNSHGAALKFADGTMIQYGTFTITPESLTPISSSNQYYYSEPITIDFPITFVDTSTLFVSARDRNISWTANPTANLTNGNFIICHSNGALNVTTIYWFAIGRWK